jgi:hypothetical protein
VFTYIAEIPGSNNSQKLADKMDKELKPVPRNVWDRLGKPHEFKKASLKERNNTFLPTPSVTLSHIHPLEPQNLPSALPLLPRDFVSTSLYPEEVFRTKPICTPMRANGEIVNKLKRQFEQIENHLRASAASSNSLERIPAKKRLGVPLGASYPLPAGKGILSNVVNELAVVYTGFKPEIYSNAEAVSSYQRPPVVRNSIFMSFSMLLYMSNQE